MFEFNICRKNSGGLRSFQNDKKIEDNQKAGTERIYKGWKTPSRNTHQAVSGMEVHQSEWCFIIQ